MCTCIICLVRCSLRENGFEFVPRPFVLRRPPQEGGGDDEEQGGGGGGDENNERVGWDLAEAPPPAYRNASQYQNVDLEHAEVVRMKSVYRLSSHAEPERASLPPDYTSTRGDDVTLERVGANLGPQETEVVGGQLPPTYSTAQMELMARRSATEQSGAGGEQLPTLTEGGEEGERHSSSNRQRDEIHRRP